MDSKEIKSRIKEMEKYLSDKANKKKCFLSSKEMPVSKLVEYVLDLYKNYDDIATTLSQINDVNKDIEGVNNGIGKIKGIIDRIVEKKKAK